MDTYVISDVHGCYDQLQELLDVVSPTSDDQVWMLGDLLDRGPKSAEALLWATTEAPENFHFLLGNHEDMAGCVIGRDPTSIPLHDGWGSHDEDVWSFNGGWETAGQLLDRTDADWRADVLWPWMRALVPFAPITVGDEDIMLVHAGFDPSQWDEDVRFVGEGLSDPLCHGAHVEVGHGFGTQWEQDMVWVRTGWYDYEGEVPLLTVFGHTPTTYLPRMVRQERSWLRFSDKVETGDEWWNTIPDESGRIWKCGRRIDIDCGCAYGGRLAALRLDDMQEFYVDGLQDI